MLNDDEEELAFSEKVLMTYIGTAGTTCFVVVVVYIINWWLS
jgi:hypothetical protein